MELIKVKQDKMVDQKRTFNLIETLPDDFLTLSDFEIQEEVILELDF
ncbi:hypothetical protein JXR93_05750 [bacterium]|nr:hypothetical protein [bacterium]